MVEIHWFHLTLAHMTEFCKKSKHGLDLGTRIQRHWVFGRDILEELNKKEKKKYSYYIGYPGLNLRDLFHADFPTFLTFE